MPASSILFLYSDMRMALKEIEASYHRANENAVSKLAKACPKLKISAVRQINRESGPESMKWPNSWARGEVM